MASTSGLQHRCVFVGNIPYDATEEQLIQICEEVGPVVSFRLVLDKETGRPKGYGFCEYKDEETALSARRNLQGYEINGRQLRVDFAENDKGVDRNREQGRGGPGLTSSTDSQKSLATQPFVGDATLQRLLVLPQAAAAASIMAEALGGPQTSSQSQFRSGQPNFPGSGNDPLANYLACMSRYQLNEIMLEMKALATKNRTQAQELLQASPQLTKALFQVQIMLGMVTPQMMQVAGNQKTLSVVAMPSVQDNKQDFEPSTPYLGQVSLHKEAAVEPFWRSSESQGKNVLPNPAIFQHSSLPPKHLPLHAHRPPLSQNQIYAQGAIPGIAGVSMPANVQAPPFPSSVSSVPQVQPSLLHQFRPVGTTSIGLQHQAILPNNSLQQSFLPHPLKSQIPSLNNPLQSTGLEMLLREARPSSSNLDLTSASRISTEKPSSLRGLVKQNEMSSATIGLSTHPSKRPRLEEGAGEKVSSADGMQNTQKQTPQLSVEEESVLLQQLMSLTPEQLSSLPSEQQQQVLEIQRTLRSKPLV
ncbi:cleavage stimulating factor 64 isoform X2 [Phalaenopsis equestris]|uniref:cleavage stimulating factor 64 isoform X2 n=1 Tax=Phalaenopsis equestris TaxID=78828 RepID=UPI0009E3D0EC|nr:cleavage stimulating factor 64 isoform X2 [Phalaenopsis equestris]